MKSYIPRGAVRSLVCLALLFGAHSVMAQATSSHDETGVRQASKDYLAAMQRGDTKALADFWTADGTYTDVNGRTVHVHDLLAKNAATAHLAHPPTSVSHVTVRFITDDVALEQGDFDTTAGNGLAPINGHYSALWVRQNDRWKLDNLTETRTVPTSSSGDELASLGVLVGDWSGQVNQTTIHISAKWDATKKYLRRDFSVTSGRSPLSGMQEIGWDPITKHIKSWVFLDDGGYGEGFWSLEGTVWMEVSTRVLPDGKLMKATQIYKFPDKNTIIWKLIRGSVDGQPAQPLEVVLKRS